MLSNKLEPFAWIFMGGLIVWGYGVATDKKAEKAVSTSASQAQRKQATTAIVQAGPQTTTWNTTEGSVIALSIPQARLGGQFVEVKHCIVWRDAVTKTSALHCDKNEIDLRDFPSDPPEIEQ